jgi:hypothetical protein
LPLLPAPWLPLYWGLMLAGAALLPMARARRAGEYLALAGALVQCSQQFSNHHFLLVLVLVYLVVLPAGEKWAMLRWQLGIVYGFSVLNKLGAGFYTGESLANLYALLQPAWLPAFLFGAAGSGAVLLAELLIPALLIARPRAGLGLLIAFHGSLVLLMPELATFGLLMTGLGLSFFVPRGELTCS